MKLHLFAIFAAIGVALVTAQPSKEKEYKGPSRPGIVAVAVLYLYLLSRESLYGSSTNVIIELNLLACMNRLARPGLSNRSELP